MFLSQFYSSFLLEYLINNKAIKKGDGFVCQVYLT